MLRSDRCDGWGPKPPLQFHAYLQLESLRRNLLASCAGELRKARAGHFMPCRPPFRGFRDDTVEQESHPPRLGRVAGIVDTAPPAIVCHRFRSRLALTLAEREEISRAVVAGHSMRSIAVRLGRAPSTISREIKRNGGQESYRASQADESAWDRGRRPKTCKLAQNRALARLVAGKLQRRWSPQQVAGWLKRTYPDDTSRQVSPETIYRSLFIQARGALKKELVEHLRRSRVMRRSRHHTMKTDKHGRITDTVSISERPAIPDGCRA